MHRFYENGRCRPYLQGVHVFAGCFQSNQVERSSNVSSGAGPTQSPRISKVMKESKSNSSLDGDRVIRVVNCDDESGWYRI
jgi:hypothetical protein